ncbi:hypothetical protein SDJN02_17256, partial [Cucurbita argyrosperma subsp. argyrosperma]
MTISTQHVTPTETQDSRMTGSENEAPTVIAVMETLDFESGSLTDPVAKGENILRILKFLLPRIHQERDNNVCNGGSFSPELPIKVVKLEALLKLRHLLYL